MLIEVAVHSINYESSATSMKVTVLKYNIMND